MFLYAKLVMNNLYEQATRQNVEDELKPGIFPVGLQQALVNVHLIDEPSSSSWVVDIHEYWIGSSGHWFNLASETKRNRFWDGWPVRDVHLNGTKSKAQSLSISSRVL